MVNRAAIRRWAIALLLAMPLGVVVAGDDGDAQGEGDYVPDDPETEWLPEEAEDRPFIERMDRGQATVSRGVFLLSRQLDRMLGTDDTLYPDEDYRSLVRVRVQQRVSDIGSDRTEAGVTGRLRLPGAQDRLSLVFSSEEPEDEIDAERGTPVELDDDRTQSVGLEFLRPSENWESSLDARLRSGSPVDLLTRGRVWRDFQPGQWRIRPRQSLFWYDARGTGATTDIRLDHPVTEYSAMRLEGSATWFDRESQFYYDQRLSYIQALSPRRSLVWQAGTRGESEPNNQLTQYYVQVRWRSRIHRDWLSLEVRPQLRRDRDDDFNTERRIFVGLEAAFGHPGAY